MRDRSENLFHAQRRADHAGGADDYLARIDTPELDGELFGRRDRGWIAVLFRTAVRVARIDDDAAHPAARFAQVLARRDHGRSNDLICGEHGRGRCQRVADQNAEIEARALDTAVGSREGESGGNVRCGKVRIQGLASSAATRAVKSARAARTAPRAVPPATPRRASADSSVSTVERSRPNAGENTASLSSGISRIDFPSCSHARKTLPTISCASRNGMPCATR